MLTLQDFDQHITPAIAQRKIECSAENHNFVRHFSRNNIQPNACLPY